MFFQPIQFSPKEAAMFGTTVIIILVIVALAVMVPGAVALVKSLKNKDLDDRLNRFVQRNVP